MLIGLIFENYLKVSKTKGKQKHCIDVIVFGHGFRGGNTTLKLDHARNLITIGEKIHEKE